MLLIILLIISCVKPLDLSHREKISSEDLINLYDEKDYYPFQQHIDYLKFVESKLELLGEEHKKEKDEFLSYTGLSSIHIATLRNDKEEVKKLIEEINKNKNYRELFKDHYKNTPLHYAAYFGYYDIFKFLLENMPGEVLNRANITNPKPIHLLVVNKDEKIEERKKILTLILSKNSDSIKDKDPVNNNVLMYAAIFDNIEMFKEIYKINPSLLEEESCRQINALDYLGMYGNLDIYKYLIEEEKVDINKTDSRDRTAFMLACANNQKDFVEYCLLNKVDISKIDDQKKSGIVYTIIYGHKDLTECIINFAKENKNNIIGKAEFQNNLLISLLACIDLYENDEENSRIMHIIRNIIREENLKDINMKDEGMSPLVYALDNEKYEIIKLLLDCRKDLKLLEKVNDHDNIIELAISKGDIKALELFINKLDKESISSNTKRWKKIAKENSVKNGIQYKEVALYLDKLNPLDNSKEEKASSNIQEEALKEMIKTFEDKFTIQIEGLGEKIEEALKKDKKEEEKAPSNIQANIEEKKLIKLVEEIVDKLGTKGESEMNKLKEEIFKNEKLLKEVGYNNKKLFESAIDKINDCYESIDEASEQDLKKYNSTKDVLPVLNEIKGVLLLAIE